VVTTDENHCYALYQRLLLVVVGVIADMVVVGLVVAVVLAVIVDVVAGVVAGVDQSEHLCE
jgi:hypothetical protein